MNFDNEIAGKSPGQVLMDVPIPKMIEMVGKGIAHAQYELDASAIRAATLMSETKVDFRDANGNVTPKSLLELGFTPAFYHFSETEMEFKVTITTKVEAGIDLGVGGNLNSGTNQSLMFGATINFDLHHKYNFDTTASSTIKTRMVAIPAPQTFIQAILDHANSGGTISAGEDSGGSLAAPVDEKGDSGDSGGAADSGNGG